MIPLIQPISGQGGNIAVSNAALGQQLVIQVRNWVINVDFDTPDVTTTGSGGWAENKRVLARWYGSAEWPLDANRMATYEGVQLVNGIYVPVGLFYPVPGQGVFQIGTRGRRWSRAHPTPCSTKENSTCARTRRRTPQPESSNISSASSAPGPSSARCLGCLPDRQ